MVSLVSAAIIGSVWEVQRMKWDKCVRINVKCEVIVIEYEGMRTYAEKVVVLIVEWGKWLVVLVLRIFNTCMCRVEACYILSLFADFVRVDYIVVSSVPVWLLNVTQSHDIIIRGVKLEINQSPWWTDAFCWQKDHFEGYFPASTSGMHMLMNWKWNFAQEHFNFCLPLCLYTFAKARIHFHLSTSKYNDIRWGGEYALSKISEKSEQSEQSEKSEQSKQSEQSEQIVQILTHSRAARTHC